MINYVDSKCSGFIFAVEFVWFFRWVQVNRLEKINIYLLSAAIHRFPLILVLRNQNPWKQVNTFHYQILLVLKFELNQDTAAKRTCSIYNKIGDFRNISLLFRWKINYLRRTINREIEELAMKFKIIKFWRRTTVSLWSDSKFNKILIVGVFRFGSIEYHYNFSR